MAPDDTFRGKDTMILLLYWVKRLASKAEPCREDGAEVATDLQVEFSREAEEAAR